MIELSFLAAALRGTATLVPHEATAVVLVLRLVLGCFFLLSGTAKVLQDSTALRRAVSDYQLAPRRLAPAIAATLPFLEVGLGSAILSGLGAQLATVVMLGLLATFSGAIVFDLLHQRYHECGCLGQLTARPIGWGLVVQNVLLAAGAVVLALAPSQVTAPPVWQVLWSMGDGAVAAVLSASGLTLLLVVWPHAEAAVAAYSVFRLNLAAPGAREANRPPEERAQRA